MPYVKEPELYRVWCYMRRRCYDKNYHQWKDYGGRGITVCPEWMDFRTFERDMSPRPSGMTLDRKDNDAGYSRDNCRWATRKDQQRNRRVAVWIEIDGRRYRAIELADQTGMKPDTLIARANAGLTYAEVISPDRRVFSGGVEKAWKTSVAVRISRTHCGNGHAWTPENTRITPQGWRNCRECHRIKMRNRTLAKRKGVS